jgi:proteasome alpha subunit
VREGENMYPVSPQAYDRAITVFSPDGRLFQVEYAKEAVKRGSTAIGIVCKNGVVLLANRYSHSKLLVLDTVRKVNFVDEDIISTSSGLAADARRLVDMARIEAQRHRITYDRPITVIDVSRKIADTIQIYTQYGGSRPFGVSMIFAGKSNGEFVMYEIEPSGAYTGYIATSIGQNKDIVDKYLESHYKKDISVKEGISLGLKALIEGASDEDKKNITPDSLDIAIIDKENNIARYLEESEIEKLISKVK